MTTAPVPEPTLLITRITVIAGPGTTRYRTAKVHDPATKETYSHSLGNVGEPIKRYLGHRVSHSIHARLGDPGYYIALPPSLGTVTVAEVTYDARNRKRSRPLDWHALDAPDLLYLETTDGFRAFLREAVVLSEQAESSAKALYNAYLHWCTRTCQLPASQTRLGWWLGQQGYTKTKQGTVTWHGLAPCAVIDDRLPASQPDAKAR